MTDDEAKTILHEMRYQPSARMAEALRHALQAIADRAALVEAWRDANATVSQGGFATLLATARRHMKGEE